VRIDGKPRQKFLFGLGSLQEPSQHNPMFMWFWIGAVARMRRRGMSDDQCRRLLAEIIRKGARKPTPQECENFHRAWNGKHSADDLPNLLGYGVTC
jgi:hypothetical protein